MRPNLFLSLLLASSTVCAASQEPRTLFMDQFIERAVARDTTFEALLIEGLTLHHQKNLRVPAMDLVLDVREQYDFYRRPDREGTETSISLSQLFPHTGTTLSAGFDTGPSRTSTSNPSAVSFSLTQDIAWNAFGTSTRLQEKIVKQDIQLSKHQVVEAYEDYLAYLMTAYLDWKEAYENADIGRSSVKENEKLLKNIRSRRKSSIALPIDVRKTELQVIAKKEKLLSLEQEVRSAWDALARVLHWKGDRMPSPERSFSPRIPFFTKDIETCLQKGRTARMLDLLVSKSRLTSHKEARDIFPSLQLKLGFQREGDETALTEKEDATTIGLSLTWNLFNPAERAEKKIAQWNEKKTALTSQDVRLDLILSLEVLKDQIKKEAELDTLAEKKVKLATAVLKDETENYTFGKVTLNDYIQAVNALDSHRFNKVLREANLAKLLVEWQRLTDQLVGDSVVK
jgi:outer membrane protein TolC